MTILTRLHRMGALNQKCIEMEVFRIFMTHSSKLGPNWATLGQPVLLIYLDANGGAP